jgi:hypothetical protein
MPPVMGALHSPGPQHLSDSSGDRVPKELISQSKYVCLGLLVIKYSQSPLMIACVGVATTGLNDIKTVKAINGVSRGYKSCSTYVEDGFLDFCFLVCLA